ncbi:probable E3 SUMO-protein ligase RNF212 [Ovis canadensis]|uniref:probable E3 SUMO-protein ligase RNF212 n=1 Tax=Ovis canadensis TaxID=37174 RepID=UPI0037529730
MASWVFCNRCFQPPRATSSFSLTSCGHVYCDACLRKGERDECLICKVACRTVLLSKHTDSDIQALFMGIDGLCRKYAKETSQISEFQEKHRRRLLAFYGEKISQLEESLRKSTLRVEQLQRVRSSQQTAFSTVKTAASTLQKVGSEAPLLAALCSCEKAWPVPASLEQGLVCAHLHVCAYVFLSPQCSHPWLSRCLCNRAESMEVDFTPSPRRKPEVATGPPRISLLSPPRDGRMGSIAHRPQHLGLTPRCSSEPQAPRIPALQMPREWPRQSPAPAAGRGAAPRQPISVSGLMQRQRPGPAGLGGLARE